MAKGNLFLGKARGRVGDVVFYVRNGKQIARAKAASVANPMTDAQQFQRAVSATISKAYQQGRAIFDHSFEGKKVPSGSQQEFIKLNMNALRQRLIADWNAAQDFDDPQEEYNLRNYVVNPGAATMCPGAYIISRGTYKSAPVTITADNSDTFVEFPAATVEQTIAEYYAALNLLEGDIITICMVSSMLGDYGRVTSPPSHFLFVRLIAKAPSSTAITATTKMSDIFTINHQGLTYDAVTDLAGTLLTSGSLDVTTVDEDGYRTSAVGVICSRDDSGVRSNSDMQIVGIGDDLANHNWTVTAASMSESWSRESFNMQSSKILEGGGF